MTNPAQASKPATTGFVYATTGAAYTTLARRAARALQKVMPGAQIDLFTDQNVADPVFAKVHSVAHQGTRPKMEAMRRTRFDRTIYMDADTLVLTPVDDLFAVLDHYDLAATLGVNRALSMCPAGEPMPRAMPVVNSGVIALRRSDHVKAFMAAWEADMRDAGDIVDQRSLRRQLWAATDLRFLALPEEYNLKSVARIDVWPTHMGAPRILHQSDLHRRAPGDPTQPLTLDEVLSRGRADHVRALLAADWSLGGDGEELETPATIRRKALDRTRRRLAKATAGQES